MKKALRIVGLLLLAIIAVIAVIAAYIHFSGIPTYEVEIPQSLVDFQVPRDSAAVARGAKIASITCVGCHLGEDGKLSGAPMLDVPAEFGFVHSRNITQHPTAGIGDWSDGELLYMLRTSIRRDGNFAPPYMPAFPRMADEDLHAIVAWLRSDDPLVQSSDIVEKESRPGFLTKLLCRVAFKPFPYPEASIALPDPNDEVALGRYIANDIIGCYGCHSADFKTMDEVVPENTVDYYGGGNPLLNKQGEVIHAPNITMDITGIGHYTREDFIQAVRWGKRPDGTLLRYPMIPHTTLTDEEVGAIYEFLKTVPKLEKTVARAEG